MPSVTLLLSNLHIRTYVASIHDCSIHTRVAESQISMLLNLLEKNLAIVLISETALHERDSNMEHGQKKWMGVSWLSSSMSNHIQLTHNSG